MEVLLSNNKCLFNLLDARKSIEYRDIKFNRFMGESELDIFFALSSSSARPDDDELKKFLCKKKNSFFLSSLSFPLLCLTPLEKIFI